VKHVFLPKRLLEERLLTFLKEDLSHGDTTSNLTIAENTVVEATVVAKERGIAAGIEEALVLCESLRLRANPLKHDGDQVEPHTSILHIAGDARTLLAGERTLLNVLSRMSGIASMTRDLVLLVTPYKTRVACTRKVAPGLGYFDKKAVFLGGGDAHRLHLADMILIKDNHIKIVGEVGETVRKARETASFSKKVEVEVSSLEDALKAARAGADVIMLDNLSPRDVKKTVQALAKKGVRQRIILEASGRVNRRNIVEYARAGVDVVSVGEITQSPKALDMSLEVTKVAH
jgi:nicotinate-nucleotide pyrophosphorylase (carboxylating)